MAAIDQGQSHSTDPPPRGLVGAAFIWGFLAGVVQMGAAAVWTSLPMSGHEWRMFVGAMLLLASPLAPAVLFALVAITGRYAVRWVAAAALAFGLGYAGATIAAIGAYPLSIDMPGERFQLGMLAIPAVLTCVVLTIWIPTHWIRRASSRISGPAYIRCPTCGYYLVGEAAASACPNCDGRRHLRRPAVWPLLPARVRWSLAAVVAVLAAIGPLVYAARWNAEIAPLRLQLSRLKPTRYVSLPSPMAGDDPDHVAGHGAFVPIEPDGSRGLLVTFIRGRTALPPVRIWLTTLGLVGSPGYQSDSDFPLQMSPQVYCDLTADQAAHLFATGLPAPLIDAFRTAGASSRPGEMWLYTDDLIRAPRPTIPVDPSPYLK